MAWRVEYIVLILISTIIDYSVAIMMGRTEEKRAKRKYLIISVVTNLGLLFTFKYFNFFNDSVQILFDNINIFYNVPSFQLLLPVGISFYTFQTLSYTIDVYRGKREPEKHFGIFALYVSFFPQLVAGPIERSTHLLPQFYKKIKFNQKRIISGLRLMLWGFFQKIVIADSASHVVNHVYSDPVGVSSISLIIATVFFAFQIYCDFSGYTDIARGAARVLGFDLLKNFNRPYASRSIAEFWRRWHMSLMSWFKDYLYIPIGGSRVRLPRWLFNITIVFLVSGLWHGAGWTFVVWGGLNAFYIIFSKLTVGLRRQFVSAVGLLKVPKLHGMIKIFTTFSLTTFAWVFFRAGSFADAAYIISTTANNIIFDILHVFDIRFIKIVFSELGVTKNVFFTIIFGIFVLEIVQYKNRRAKLAHWFDTQPAWIRQSMYYALILIILFFGDYGEQTFIYFQF